MDMSAETQSELLLRDNMCFDWNIGIKTQKKLHILHFGSVKYFYIQINQKYNIKLPIYALRSCVFTVNNPQMS